MGLKDVTEALHIFERSPHLPERYEGMHWDWSFISGPNCGRDNDRKERESVNFLEWRRF